MPTVFLRDLCHCQRVTALRVKEVETATLPLLPFGISSQGFRRRTLTRILRRTDEDESTMTKKFVEWFSSPVTAVWKCLMFWFRDPDSPAYCIWLLYELNKCLISRDLSCRKPGKQSSSFCALYCTVLYRRTKSCYYRKLAGLVLSSYLCFWNDPVLVRCTQRHRIRPKLRM